MNSFKKIALIMAAAVTSTFLTVVSPANAAVSAGYDLSADLADGARGVTEGEAGEFLAEVNS